MTRFGPTEKPEAPKIQVVNRLCSDTMTSIMALGDESRG
jgi:hypothetical protein